NPLRKASTWSADVSGEPALRKPITATDRCCAPTLAGQIIAAPASPMNSRRLIQSPRRRGGGQILTDLRQKLTRAVGLGNARRARLLNLPGQCIRGNGDDGDRVQ